MVPTYFRRELRDRALQRRPRLRAFVFPHCHGRACPACGAEAPSARRRPGHPRLCGRV